MLKNILFLIIALFIFAGCSTRYAPMKQEKIIPVPTYKPEDNTWITKALRKEYKKWSDTPYEYGGDDMDGIDCSSLVQAIYLDAFGIELPRTTDEQANTGYEIPLNSSKEGDLVFFKTGRNTKHAGIIIDKGLFLHTSTKEGVKISQLSNPYWRAKYWKTRRVLPRE